LFRHKKTKARVLVLSNEDINKVFNIAFRTPSDSDKGVQHIIEHTVLCGSKNFPVKDPFIELIKGSVNTYLNATTYPDKTMYPVASYNDKDFKNLMHVYLDAVFNPNIYDIEEIFKQEGWHYELEDKDSPVIYNGVVYNEMKGAYSSVDGIMETYLIKELYPDCEYKYDSGGNPEVIPSLTREEYLAYHSKYYHPSNSYIYLYGDIDVEERLNWIDENYLKDYDELKVDSQISLQPDFSEPREADYEYAVNKGEAEGNKTMYAYGIKLDVTQNDKVTKALAMCTEILLDVSGAKVKEAIVKAGLGEEIISDYCDLFRQGYLAIYVKNAPAGKKKELFEVIENTMKQVVSEGIDKDLLLARINLREFAAKEKEFGITPKGLIYGIRAMNTWLYEDEAAFNKFKDSWIYDEFHKDIESDYFEKLIEEHFINNNNKVMVEYAPSEGLTARVDKKTREELEAFKASLSDEEIEKLIADTKKLKDYQNTPSTPEELNTIPLLTRDDLSKTVRCSDIKEDSFEGMKVFRSNVKSNGISYYMIRTDLSDYKDNVFALNTLTLLLGSLSTKNYSYSALEAFKGIHLGAASFGVDIDCDKDFNLILDYMTLVKCLNENLDKSFEYLKEVLFETQFDDVDRIKELILEQLSKLKSSGLYAGHATASERALAHIYEDEAIKDYSDGIGYMKLLEKLINDNKIDEFAEYAKTLITSLRSKNNLTMLYIGSDEDYELFKSEIKKSNLLDCFTDEVPAFEHKFINDTVIKDKSEGFTTPAKIQYVALAGKYDPSKIKKGIVPLIGSMLNSGYLWNRVRVLNGAYGVFIRLQPNGKAVFSSYRDPKLTETLEAYREAGDYLATAELDERELDKAVISTCGSIDSPISDRAEALRAFRWYLTKKDVSRLNEEREQLLNLDIEDIRAFADVVREVASYGEICVIGSEEKIKENEGIFNNIITF
ncbi:MAG: insulinase family protein, partial [Lachnospiraceae bacterium]|nr:insulinase family protein [Lachnospiraceae bacterium]